MKLLFVLSQIELTGAETYALTLARALKAQGHEIIFVSEKINAPCDFKFYPLPLHTDNHTTFGRIKNITIPLPPPPGQIILFYFKTKKKGIVFYKKKR